MLGARQTISLQPMPYATSADFCQIFQQNMNRLFLLSVLLTADGETAEKCFVTGLEDAGKGNPVFREWADSWARRTIIRNAIRMMRPRAGDEISSSAVVHSANLSPEMEAIVELPAFERFVFVMSVLERYSDHECSLLLGCNRGEVIAARSRALLEIGKTADAARRPLPIDTGRELLKDDGPIVLQAASQAA